MFNKLMSELGRHGSVIREMSAYGAQRAAMLGADSVMDFSIGDPCAPVPVKVREAISALSSVDDHSYTPAQGIYEARKAVSDGISRRFGADVPPELIYMTSGASSALAIAIRALAEDGDEFILCAPYFSEYPVYVRSAGASVVSVPFTHTFDIDLSALAAEITPKTKAVIINSPNNPSGKIYSDSLLRALSALLLAKSRELSKPIYLISDEPYREICYAAPAPFPLNYYPHTLVCYSYSKIFSLPGERIGYLALSPAAQDAPELFASICGAGRALGYVCAPALFQRVVALCESESVDISFYQKNRDLLYNGMRDIGFDCILPEGAFYLFVKVPDGNSREFSERAKRLGVLTVPGDEFAAPGYCRFAYCTSPSTILRALPLLSTLLST